MTKKAGVGDPRFSTSAAWFDYDRDGDLDLYVCNYCRWSPATNKVCQGNDGRPHLPAGPSTRASSGTLYRNNGDGTFADVTRKAGHLQRRRQEPGRRWSGTRTVTAGWIWWWPTTWSRTCCSRTTGTAPSPSGAWKPGSPTAMRASRAPAWASTSADTANNGRESVLIGNNTREGLAQFLTRRPGQLHRRRRPDRPLRAEPAVPHLWRGIPGLRRRRLQGYLRRQRPRQRPGEAREGYPHAAAGLPERARQRLPGERPRSWDRRSQQKRVWRGLAYGRLRQRRRPGPAALRLQRQAGPAAQRRGEPPAAGCR